MAKLSASILVILALFAIVHAEQFQTINFDQGRFRLRNLATTTSLNVFEYTNFTNVTAVGVNLGTDYITRAAIDTTKTPTYMMIFLAGSTTGFCTSCSNFVQFQCSSNACGADQAKYQQFMHPMYSVSSGNPFTLNVTIGSDATSWKLKNSALLYSYSNEYSRNIQYPGTGGYSYIQNGTTFGFIGMGVEGDSVQNFQGDHPLFSVTVNGSGSGQLIFGKDTTKIDSKRVAQAITADANWTMTTQNISIGPNMTATTSRTTKLLFDLNYPGLGLPGDYYSTIFTDLMVKQYGLVYNTTGGNYQFPWVYAGNLANLGSIVFGLSNGQSVTIAPEVYTKKLEDGYYAVQIQSVSSVNTNVYKGTYEYANFAIFGWSIMSNYYTVFEKTATGNPTITLNPTYVSVTGSDSGSTTTTTTSSWKTILIIAVVVLVALVVISLAAKKKNNLTKSDLGVELRAARV